MYKSDKPSETKSHLEQFYQKFMQEDLAKIINECIHCLKPRSNKNKFECKNCGCTEFYVLNFQNYSCEILTACNV